MVAGESRFGHGSLAISVESCKKDGGFDLGGGDRRLIVNTVKLTRRNLKRGAVIAVYACDLCAHIGKRFDDPSHRTGV